MGYKQRIGGGGNAAVPNDAPIQPPQAFVDNITAVTDYLALQDVIIFASKGFIYIDSALVENVIRTQNQINLGATGFDLSGNAIAVSNVNAILSACVDSGVSDGNLDLSGGTSAAPTGQGIVDKATLITAGWTVTTN